MKKVFWINLIIFTATILLLTSGCKKSDVSSTTSGAPIVSTKYATNRSATGATLFGHVNANGLSTAVTFEYGTTISYDSTAIAYQSPVKGNYIQHVSEDISGLTPGTTYHFRVKAENSHGTVYGNDEEFKCGFPPVAITLGVTNNTCTAATLNGTVNANCVSSVVTFQYGTTTSYGQEVIAEQSPLTGNSFTNVSADISGLIPNPNYHFRVKAENSFWTSYGDDNTIKSGQIPTLTTTPVTYITNTTAISGGNITDDGCMPITERGVDWSTLLGRPPVHYTTHNGTGTGSFTSQLTGLQPGTKYYIKAYATNSIGIAYGNIISFTTTH